VQVQKRETERQLQARINSYAYISQKEEEEAWKELQVSEGRLPETSGNLFAGKLSTILVSGNFRHCRKGRQGVVMHAMTFLLSLSCPWLLFTVFYEVLVCVLVCM